MTTITQVPFSVGRLMRKFIQLADTLKSMPAEERQLAIQLAKVETQYICQTLLTDADMIRILDGRQPMMPHPEQ